VQQAPLSADYGTAKATSTPNFEVTKTHRPSANNGSHFFEAHGPSTGDWEVGSFTHPGDRIEQRTRCSAWASLSVGMPGILPRQGVKREMQRCASAKARPQ
jgi:hypothetical protein